MSQLQLYSYLFPIIFIGFWLFISTILGFAAGWFRLQDHYSRGDERPLLKLRGRSGSMGMGVAMNGILSLSACTSGLRIGIWRIFGPFQRPILVPWNEIRATMSRSIFGPTVRLSFGVPAVGRLKIDARTWQRLREAAAQANVAKLPPPIPHVTLATSAKGMALQWAFITLGAGSFFYIASRSRAGQELPVALCFGFPGIVFGFATLIRLVRQR